VVIIWLGCLSDGCVPNKPPIADFTYSPFNPHVFESVLFNASASYDPDGFIASYTWDFGDENVTKILNPLINHSYETPGTCNITLTVEDSAGLKDSTSKEITVKKPPFATFQYLPLHPKVGQEVIFNASESKPSGGHIIGYFWNFGDNQTETINDPIMTHIYNSHGNYSVTLRITDSEGETAVATKPMTIMATPIAVFTFSPLLPRAGQNVVFNASESKPSKGNIVSYLWDFGDSLTENVSDPMVTHVYNTFGNYSVTLVITDSEGETAMAIKTITVIAPPKADFFFEPLDPHIGEIITFNASPTVPNGGFIVEYKWNFGDGSDAEYGVIVQHKYAKTGEYTVSLNATDSEGEWNLKETVLKVLPHRADLNEDGRVDVLDLYMLCRAYGSYPGHERWDPKADINQDGKVNIMDAALIAKSFHS